MKALNTKERNSSILRFSLWLIICVLVICIPVLFLVVFPSNKDKEELKVTQAELVKYQDEVAKLNREMLFLKDTLAHQINDINNIQKKFEANKSKVATYNLELLDIANKLEADTAGKVKWRVEICKDISSISKDLIEANEIISKPDNGKPIDQDKLNAVVIEFQSISDDVTKQLPFKSANTLHEAFVRIDKDLKKAIRQLGALK
jgi:hypothetical protein